MTECKELCNKYKVIEIVCNSINFYEINQQFNELEDVLSEIIEILDKYPDENMNLIASRIVTKDPSTPYDNSLKIPLYFHSCKINND